MQPLARAGRNLALKSLGEVLARLCFLALFIYAARVLGAEEYGRYSYAASLAALALIGMDLGLNTLLVRDGARHRQQVGAYAGTMLLIKSLLALMVLALLWVLARPEGAGAWLVLAVAGAQALWGMAELGVAGLNALERMDREALVKTCGRLAALVLAGGMLLAGWGLWGLVAGLLLANALAAALSLRLLRAQGPFSLRLERGFLAYLGREALPLALTSVFILVYFRVDIVMLEMMGRGFVEIGWYAAGVRIVDAVGVVPAMVAGSVLPVLSSLAAGDREGLARLYRQALRLLLILGLPAAVGLFVVRQQVAVLIYGPDFLPTARAFVWLAPVLVFLFLNHLQLATLTALGRQRLCALATFICVPLNLGLNLLLIPAYGFVGAAAATLITELALFIMCAAFIHARLGGSGLLGRAPRPALAAALMGALLYLLPGWHVLLLVALGAALYAAALIALGGLRLSELRELWGLLRPGAGPEAGA